MQRLAGDSTNSAQYLDTSLLSEPAIATGGRLHLLPGLMVADEGVNRICSQLVGDIDQQRGVPHPT